MKTTQLEGDNEKQQATRLIFHQDVNNSPENVKRIEQFF